MTKKVSFLKRVIAAILVLILATGTNMVAFAAGDNTHDSIRINGSGLNTHYIGSESVIANDALPGDISGSYTAGVRYSANADEQKKTTAIAKYIRDEMIARKSPISVKIETPRTDFNVLIGEIFQLAISEELADSAVAGDYLAWQYGGYKYTGSSLTTDDGYEYNINLYVTYYTTADEEAKVTNAVNNALNAMRIDNLTEYEKVKNIYDYICRVCNYDYTTNDSYTKKFTAYGAIIDGSAVCQGYSALLYRMLKQAGIDGRIITSTAHSWNIAKIGDYYYNLDVTWDDSNYDEGKAYSYFLKCGPHFDDHKRQPEYNTAEFNRRYPMSDECYTNFRGATKCMEECPKHDYVLVKTIPATTESVGYNFYSCAKCGKQYTAEVQPLPKADNNNITQNYTTTTTISVKQVTVTQQTTVHTTATHATVTVEKTNLSTVTAKSKGIHLKWHKVANANGYEIQYSTDNKFTAKNTKTVVVNKNSTTTKDIAKLKGNKKYFIRIRAYKNHNGTKCYSSWSTVKNVKTKK